MTHHCAFAYAFIGSSGNTGPTAGCAMYLCAIMPTPSMIPKKHAHEMAEFRVCFHPPRMAKAPPVKNPAMMAFHASSLFLMPFTVQSNVENNPPHTPKLPPNTGALALMALKLPYHLSPYGEFLKPLIPCQKHPPMTPMEKAPPKSLKITTGHGSLLWSAIFLVLDSLAFPALWLLLVRCGGGFSSPHFFTFFARTQAPLYTLPSR